MPVVPSDDLLDAVGEILARVARETDVSVRADLLARTRSTVDALLRGELSTEQAIAALSEPPPLSGVQRRR
jgi:hypothetical protein